MFKRIQQYELIDAGGQWYRPRAYADPQPDGTWHGWLTFFPVAGGLAVAPSRPETTQSTLDALSLWATGLSRVYLEGALTRALRLAAQAPVVARLDSEEYAALEEAEDLETAADVERAAAEADDVAAGAARAKAARIREERLTIEDSVAAVEEAAANADADAHDAAAKTARRAAADAAARRRPRTD
jgi:hypothetical protein